MAQVQLPLGYDRWTFFLMNTAPMLLLLPIGIWLCYRNRFRRPQVARLIGCAMVIELLVAVNPVRPVVDPILRLMMDAGYLSNITQAHLLAAAIFRIVNNIARAGIWAIAIWAGLHVEPTVVASLPESTRPQHA